MAPKNAKAALWLGGREANLAFALMDDFGAHVSKLEGVLTFRAVVHCEFKHRAFTEFISNSATALAYLL